MNSFKMLPQVDDNTYVTAKMHVAVTDADVGKPVKLYAADTYTICSDGDDIDGFLNSVESHTSGGKVIATVQIAGRRCVQVDDASNIALGALVEAAAPATLNTAETNKLGKVSGKAAIAADLATDASGTLIAASVNAILADLITGRKRWRLISGTGLDEDTTAVVELV